MAFVTKSKFIVSKNDIKAFPFQEYHKLKDGELEDLASLHSLTSYNLWMLPQMQALFGRFRVRKDDSGKYLPLAMLGDNIGNDPYMIGLWNVVTKLKRSSLVKAQANAQFSEYSALVPLILAGIRKYQDIPYSAWSTEGLEHTMDKNLYEAITCGYKNDISNERLVELRNQGLQLKSGPKLGEVKKATSSWCLTGVKHTEIGELPKLAQTMITQIWVAHPSVRSHYMILDPEDWDRVPEVLIGSDVVAKKFYSPEDSMAYQHPEEGANPWD